MPISRQSALLFFCVFVACADVLAVAVISASSASSASSLRGRLSRRGRRRSIIRTVRADSLAHSFFFLFYFRTDILLFLSCIPILFPTRLVSCPSPPFTLLLHSLISHFCRASPLCCVISFLLPLSSSFYPLPTFFFFPSPVPGTPFFPDKQPNPPSPCSVPSSCVYDSISLFLSLRSVITQQPNKKT